MTGPVVLTGTYVTIVFNYKIREISLIKGKFSLIFSAFVICVYLLSLYPFAVFFSTSANCCFNVSSNLKVIFFYKRKITQNTMNAGAPLNRWSTTN